MFATLVPIRTTVSTGVPQTAATTVPELLKTGARDLAGALDAAGCVISRLVGELIVEIAEHSQSGKSLHLGYGYLLSEYPLTDEVVREREPRTVSLHDPHPDPQEAKLLNELGFDSLLMLPLACGKEVWGLVEIYGSGASFDEDAVETAAAIVARVSTLLEPLERARRQG